MFDDSKLAIAHHNYNNWYYGYTCEFPNITLDNLTYYNAKTWERREPGFQARLFYYRELAAKMHLPDSGEPSYFACLDEDGDGYVDEPIMDVNKDGIIDEADRIDMDGDGRVGNTSIKYEEALKNPDFRRGIPHPTSTFNLNAVKPPKYFKVINNETEDGKCVCNYIIKDTSLEGISDGGWYRAAGEPDTMGGFFGRTEFIYGNGEGESFVGTANKNGISESFVFIEEYHQ